MKDYAVMMFMKKSDVADFSDELRSIDAKMYATYYTTRKDTEWAAAHIFLLILGYCRTIKADYTRELLQCRSIVLKLIKY